MYCPLLVTRVLICALSLKMFPLTLQRLIETASWGEDPTALEQQLLSHQRFHKSIQRSAEVDRAREELVSCVVADVPFLPLDSCDLILFDFSACR